MKHVDSRSARVNSTPVGALKWSIARQDGARASDAFVLFRKTRSTLSLHASEFRYMGRARLCEAMAYLLRSSRLFARGEILIECLEQTDACSEPGDVIGHYDMLHSALIRASRTKELAFCRVALERRGAHFDMRIYTEVH